MATKKKARKYKKVSCHRTKAAAKKAAKELRTKGKTAKVVGLCVHSAGARKKTGKKKTTRRKKRA